MVSFFYIIFHLIINKLHINTFRADRITNRKASPVKFIMESDRNRNHIAYNFKFYRRYFLKFFQYIFNTGLFGCKGITIIQCLRILHLELHVESSFQFFYHIGKGSIIEVEYVFLPQGGIGRVDQIS